MFPITQQWICGRLRLHTCLRQQDSGKSKILLFCFLVWHTCIARTLGFLSAICSQGNSWFDKRMWGHSYCCGWKGSCGNWRPSQSSYTSSDVCIRAAELSLGSVLPIFCPVLLLPGYWSHMSHFTWNLCQQEASEGEFVCFAEFRQTAKWCWNCLNGP